MSLAKANIVSYDGGLKSWKVIALYRIRHGSVTFWLVTKLRCVRVKLVGSEKHDPDYKITCT